MSYNPTIPKPADLLSNSQADLLTNFSLSNNIIGLDHVNFDNSLPLIATLGYLTIPADEGKHTIIHTKMINNATAAPATAANEGAIYTKEVSAGGRVEAFYRYPNSGPISQLSFIKAWVKFNGALASPIAPVANSFYNVTNITYGGAYDYVIHFATALANDKYAVIISDTSNAVFTITGRTVNDCTINTNIIQPQDFNVLIIGY